MKERRKDSDKKHKACKSFYCNCQKLFKRGIYRSSFIALVKDFKIMKLKNIPTGNSKEDIKTRERIISDFYYEWKRSNPTQRKNSILYNSDKDIKNPIGDLG